MLNCLNDALENQKTILIRLLTLFYIEKSDFSTKKFLMFQPVINNPVETRISKKTFVSKYQEALD